MNIEDCTQEFAEKWYVVRPAVIDPGSLRIVHDHVVARADSGMIATGDRQVGNAPGAYGDRVTDTCLEVARYHVERATGLRLWPTFSYFRVYRNGNLLRAHRDRPSCEISMTVNLGMDAVEPWPIWIAGPKGIASVALGPGDGLVYRGCDCFHWREPFPGRYLAQMFLHYVDRNGPKADWKFDRRAALALG